MLGREPACLPVCDGIMLGREPPCHASNGENMLGREPPCHASNGVRVNVSNDLRVVGGGRVGTSPFSSGG